MHLGQGVANPVPTRTLPQQPPRACNPASNPTHPPLSHPPTTVPPFLLMQWPLSPTRLGIRPWDLGLPNEYTLGHCGLSADKLAFTSRHYSPLVVTWHNWTLLNSFFTKKNWSKLIFKVPTTISRVPPSHILTNLIMNTLLDANNDRELGKYPRYMVENSHNWLFANRLRRRKSDANFKVQNGLKSHLVRSNFEKYASWPPMVGWAPNSFTLESPVGVLVKFR